MGKTLISHNHSGSSWSSRKAKAWLATSSSLLIWFSASALVHPLPHDISDRAFAPLLAGASIAPPVAGVFERACANCHSEKTHWPWYSQLAPMSWLVENDVKEARKHLNLSRWDRLDSDEQRLALTSIATVIESEEMPPRRYVVAHPEARLSTEVASQVIEWARRERHRLKSAAFPDMPNAPSRGLISPPRGFPVLRQIKSGQQPVGESLRATATTAATPPFAGASRGKELFKKRCTGCHALDGDRVGPRLRGVFGNSAGSVPGFPYSEAIRNSCVIWDNDSLDKWLADPAALIPDSDMAFRVANPSERTDILAYLKTLSRKSSNSE